MQDTRTRDGSGKKRIRTACVSCRRRKIRCDGGFPCEQCTKLEYTCEYDGVPAKRTTAQVLDSQPLDTQALVYGPLSAASSASSSSSASAPCVPFSSQQLPLAPALPRELSFNGVSFGSREMQFLNLYLQHVHPSYPTVPYRMLRDGINPVKLEMLGLPGAGDTPRLCASRATSWAAAAYGASFVDVSLAQEYMGAAVRHLRQCFEVPSEEIVTAYMMVGETCFQLGRPDLFYRYIEFADAMEETMPEMSRERQLVLAYIRMHALSVSNKTRFYPKGAILPPLEEVERMDLPLRAMFLSQLGAQKIEEVVFNPRVDKAEKVRACREVINLMNPVLEQLENDPQYSNCTLGKFGLYVQMCYFWAACGNRERALWHCDRFLTILETNLHFMALPEMAHLQMASTFLRKLGAYDLQHRLERLFTLGRRYMIWKPQRTTEVDLLLHIEALFEDLVAGCGYESPSQFTVIDASDTSTTQGSSQCPPSVEILDNDDDDDATELWELLDEFPTAV